MSNFVKSTIMTDSNAKEIRTGRLIAISSLVFCILLIIHHFIVLDESTAKSILSLAGQKHQIQQ